MNEEPQPPSRPEFGTNEWLVEDMYEKYLKDKSSVDPAWWNFFEDYSPRRGSQSVSAAAKSERKKTEPAPPPDASMPRPEARRMPSAPRSSRTSSEDRPAPRHIDLEEIQAPQAAATPAIARYTHESPDRLSHQGACEDREERLRGAAARIVSNMEASLQIPTATTVRAIPAKVLIENRIMINAHLARESSGRVSFTHLIGYAMAEALAEIPDMNVSFTQTDGKPTLVHNGHVNLGIAIDLVKPEGARQLVVPAVHSADSAPFVDFWTSYDDIVRRARTNKLTVDDFAGVTASLTNPGGMGTQHSVPRLMPGQGVIVGVGAMDYPAEFAGATEEKLAEMGLSKRITLTSTYDHRVIQGALSGEFLRLMQEKLIGIDGFYDRVFSSLRIPYEPVRWERDLHGEYAVKAAHVIQLIHSYRVRGHLLADIDPLAYRQRGHQDLNLASHGLSLWDMDRTFASGGFAGQEKMKLRDILTLLRDTYCRRVGIEYMHLEDPGQREWLASRLEREPSALGSATQKQILRKLNEAEAFETFLQTKYVGQKRFSLEGGESLIPLLDAVLTEAADSGYPEVGIGMAHRGRLNVLANIAGKSYSQIFAEFEGNEDPRSVQGSGDVKYHLGTEGVFTAPDGQTTRVHLAANPSHLEAANAVLEGIVRAKQDRMDLGEDGYNVLPILIHGDAAFAGQGVIQETLNLSQLRGYRTGGTIHIIVNNQIGFTTGTVNSRSTDYCTDVAKGFQIPIFHVNGDDPEEVVRVARLAFEFRQEFARDVVIDMVCYRRRGHNEGDDPSMTQPVMYSLIDAKRSVRKIYTEALINRRDITVEEAQEVLRHYQGELERAFAETREGFEPPTNTEQIAGLERPEAQQSDAGMMVGWTSAVSPEVLTRIGQAQVRPPEGFVVHPKLTKLLDKRARMSREGNIDWAYAELLAFGSLLLEGTPVRLTGQDSRRGTFTQRHAVFHDYETGAEWTPLWYLAPEQGKLWIYDSSLSEYSVSGFEYGYSVERPEALVLWEAQFGDFFNGAQTIMDEFVSSAEQKWGQHSSVVFLLPHGFEGQGPDHSSARIERFLQLAAEDNMTIAQPSTPASHFHLLRRQAYARPRRPLIEFTPKSMLRNKAAVSAVEDFTSGEFREVIGDTEVDPTQVRRVAMCSGKLYWDLLAHREQTGDRSVAIIRLEQLYPLRDDQIRDELARYSTDAELLWAQDEPENQGAAGFLLRTLAPLIDRPLRLASRAAAASPAAGSHSAHVAEQQKLVQKVFG